MASSVVEAGYSTPRRPPSHGVSHYRESPTIRPLPRTRSWTSPHSSYLGRNVDGSLVKVASPAAETGLTYVQGHRTPITNYNRDGSRLVRVASPGTELGFPIYGRSHSSLERSGDGVVSQDEEMVKVVALDKTTHYMSKAAAAQRYGYDLELENHGRGIAFDQHERLLAEYYGADGFRASYYTASNRTGPDGVRHSRHDVYIPDWTYKA